MRLAIATLLSASLQQVLKSGKTSQLSDIAALAGIINSEKPQEMLQQIDEEASGEPDMVVLPERKDFDAVVKSAVLLACLQTRTDSNINLSVLKQLEESADFSELRGFFPNNTVKKLVDVVIRHFSQLVRKRIVKQKEAETLIQAAVLNFDCTSVDAKLVNQCIIDSLTTAIAQESKSDARTEYNQQFNMNTNNEHYFVQKKSKLQRNDAKQEKPILVEFDQPEIDDAI